MFIACPCVSKSSFVSVNGAVCCCYRTSSFKIASSLNLACSALELYKHSQQSWTSWNHFPGFGIHGHWSSHHDWSYCTAGHASSSSLILSVLPSATHCQKCREFFWFFVTHCHLIFVCLQPSYCEDKYSSWQWLQCLIPEKNQQMNDAKPTTSCDQLTLSRLLLAYLIFHCCWNPVTPQKSFPATTNSMHTVKRSNHANNTTM